jgi:glycosyltransferase involved in cell wall biosynthesis
LIGHAHGSDVRTSLDHPLWGRIVRHNLKNCTKVLVSTPDIFGRAREIREDAEYLPNPVDSEFFYPKPLAAHKGKKKVLIASDSNWSVKGTDTAVRALGKIKDQVDVSIIEYGEDYQRTLALASSLGLKLNRLPKAKHEELNQYYWNSDAVIDRLTLGSLGMVSLEAIACGRPAIAFVSSEYEAYKDFPMKGVRTEDDAAALILQADARLWQKQSEYLEKEHNTRTVVKRLLKIYDQAMG